VRVLIASAVEPFTQGGGTLISDWLRDELIVRGHEVDQLDLPFDGSDVDLLTSRLTGFRLFDVSDEADRLIAIRWPAHLLRHPSKVVWFIHHYRELFDLWGTAFQGMPPSPALETTRELVRAADCRALTEAHAVYANSSVVRDRVRRFNNLDIGIAFPPVTRPERFWTSGYGDFVFYPSRIVGHKRQMLAVEALAETRTPVRLVIAGEASPHHLAQDLVDRASELDVSDRLTVIPRWITETEKLEYLAGCLAVAYLPFDEDSYGYPSVEAHLARKAVLTTLDGGGTQELVMDGINGFVTAPTPEAIAQRFDELWEDRVLARRLGERGNDRLGELGINWDKRDIEIPAMNVAVVENFKGFSNSPSRGTLLKRGLESAGHRVALIRLPWSDKTAKHVLRSMVAIRTMRIAASDRVIALDFPSYYVDHWAKVVWLDDTMG